jgi:hypothetical protein
LIFLARRPSTLGKNAKVVKTVLSPWQIFILQCHLRSVDQSLDPPENLFNLLPQLIWSQLPAQIHGQARLATQFNFVASIDTDVSRLGHSPNSEHLHT